MYDFIIEFILCGFRLSSKTWSAVNSAVSDFKEKVPGAEILSVENQRTGVKEILAWDK